MRVRSKYINLHLILVRNQTFTHVGELLSLIEWCAQAHICVNVCVTVSSL